jgi:uncharacterized membrane protein
MSRTRHEKLRDLANNSDANFDQINEFLTENITEDELLTQILKQTESNNPTIGQKMADAVAEFGGSWAFILSFFVMLVSWIVLNAFALSNKGFDPYPFILLNLILSCIAAIQAPIIMMSQNRKEQKDRQRAEHDYLINLKAEIEIRNLQLNMKKLFEVQKRQIEILEELKSKA